MDSIEELFKYYYRPLCMYATSIMGSTDSVEDIVMDSFVDLWNRQKAIQITNTKSYLYRSVRNACYDLYNTSKNHSSLDLSSANDVVEEEAVDDSERRARLWTAIDALPSKCRKIFLMSKIENKTYGEIAQQLGISIKTVEAQMTKALKRLRSCTRDIYNYILFFFTLH
ncbi:MAG: RNA polymerase sigma-70 factor [Prevotella sp.]|uniref:RNA polymerase sigma-70 factor n=1 Tax=Prevotella sp. TaxID=59823 RepID=UPI0025873122|nr:RNA polymerase sigma-70 factor [Prevotella sp.]MDD6854102.1 RNA polymerase sigma-70 factor [Prevotella sp.]